MANVGTVKSIHPRVRPVGDIGNRVRKERAAVVGEWEHFKRLLAVGLDAALYAASVFGPTVSMGPFHFGQCPQHVVDRVLTRGTS